MNQSAHEKVRKTIEVDIELSNVIQKMADDKNWSFSYMSYVLLQQAIKEKGRKRNAKKDNTQYSAGNMGSRNSTG